MLLVVKYIVDEAKLMSFALLHSTMFSFDYGPDRSSKPSNALRKEGSTLNLKTSGSEMLVLVRYFALMVGPFVPRGDKIWHLYLLLRKLLDSLFVHSVYVSDIEQLKVLIEEFLFEYHSINNKLQPKFHFLTHYPAMFSKFGPLVYLSSMRFEAKHKISKIAAKAVCTRTNITKTIAIRNQLTLHQWFLDRCPIKKFTQGKATENHSFDSEFIKSKFKIVPSTNLFSVRKVTLDGNTIRCNDVLTVDLCLIKNEPILAEVESIFTNDSDVFFVCLPFTNIEFDPHYFSYYVERSINQDKLYFSRKDLHSIVPNTLTRLRDSKLDKMDLFVTLRSKID